MAFTEDFDSRSIVATKDGINATRLLKILTADYNAGRYPFVGDVFPLPDTELSESQLEEHKRLRVIEVDADCPLSNYPPLGPLLAKLVPGAGAARG